LHVVVKVKKNQKKRKLNCYSCLESSKTEVPGKVICHRWKVVVNCTHARICPDFTPQAPPVRRGRRKPHGGGRGGSLPEVWKAARRC